MADLEIGEGRELEIPGVWNVAQIVCTEPLVKPEGFESYDGRLIHGFITSAVNEQTIELEQAGQADRSAVERTIKSILALNPNAEVLFT